ncbi:Survival motor neuron protein [Papilio xuthus]|uniref:Survival motor neuron protein n=1 Tax=Papilio xuthus TaxID=66420 RepID=A0A194QC82_PAPXU|nr:Survival motor neuron protein [Papilio xuthus]
MSNCELLYVKGMNLSETDETVEEDIWDDRKLNDAYDKALKIANAEVAKRVAMSTNTQNLVKNPEKDQTKTKNDISPQKLKCPQKKSVKWQAGMPCRAVYDEDGQEYEAFVLRIINDKECIVKFLDGSFQKKKKSNKKKNQRKMNFPDVPIFNPTMLGNLNSMDMPLPPPPPIGFGSEHDSSEDQAISSMLLSWYMSGYYTGLYQGMKR